MVNNCRPVVVAQQQAKLAIGPIRAPVSSVQPATASKSQTIAAPNSVQAISSKPALPSKPVVVTTTAATNSAPSLKSSASEFLAYLTSSSGGAVDLSTVAAAAPNSGIMATSNALAEMSALAAEAAANVNFKVKSKRVISKDAMFEATKNWADQSMGGYTPSFTYAPAAQYANTNSYAYAAPVNAMPAPVDKKPLLPPGSY